MSQQGGLSYQMMKALQAIFRPGGSRHEDKQHGRNQDVIRSIGTMQSMVADVHEFARFIRRQWPEVSEVEDVEPEMAQTFVEELIRRERSGGSASPASFAGAWVGCGSDSPPDCGVAAGEQPLQVRANSRKTIQNSPRRCFTAHPERVGKVSGLR
jgi:hypothetical protein